MNELAEEIVDEVLEMFSNDADKAEIVAAVLRLLTSSCKAEKG